MVVAEEMEQTVQEQVEDAVFKGLLPSMRLTGCRWQGDNDIAKQWGYGLTIGHWTLGKSQHIGCPVLVAIDTIESPEKAVAGQDDTELLVCAAEVYHGLLQVSLEGSCIDRQQTLTVLHANRHGGCPALA
jgi:hypothetical protein